MAAAPPPAEPFPPPRRRCSAPGRISRKSHAASSIPAVIPIVRAPDDPGIDDEPVRDEFAEQIDPPQGQAGGWRGFLSRWGIKAFSSESLPWT